MKKYLVFIGIAVALLVSFPSCNDENNLDELAAEEQRLLKEHIENNYPGLEPKPSGLYYIEVEEGDGDEIEVGDEVQIYFTGTLLTTGNVFSTTADEFGHHYEAWDMIIGSGGSIQGLEEGVSYMKVGGRATLIIPSNLAYGATINGSIPRFSTLIYDVKLHKKKVQ